MKFSVADLNCDFMFNLVLYVFLCLYQKSTSTNVIPIRAVFNIY